MAGGKELSLEEIFRNHGRFCTPGGFEWGQGCGYEFEILPTPIHPSASDFHFSAPVLERGMELHF